jgi:hypothetical protein
MVLSFFSFTDAVNIAVLINCTIDTSKLIICTEILQWAYGLNVLF